MKKLFLSILSIFILSGCYNYQELNDLALTSALGIDKTNEGYKITAQVVNTNKSNQTSDSSDPEITTYTYEAKTLQEAIRQITLESPNRLYIHQVQIFLISEEVARDGINDIIDLFFRGVESRKQSNVLITYNSTAEDILKTITPLDTINASNIRKSLIINTKYLGTTYEITFEEMVNDYLNDKTEISLPSITLINNNEEGEKTENIQQSSPNVKIVLSNMGIFKDDKLLGYLDKEESIGLNYIKGNIISSIISYECDTNKYIVTRVTKTKTSVDIVKDQLKIKINIEGSANIGELNCYIDIEKESGIKEIENRTNEEIERIINKTITTIKDTYNTDVFGFLDLYYKNNNKYYLKIEKDWYLKNYQQLEFEIKSNIKIIEKGNIIKVRENNE